MCQRFFSYNQEQNFRWIRQEVINLPIDPHYKKAHFCNVMSIYNEVTKVGGFYNWGIWGKSLSFIGSSCKKLWHTSWKFQLEIRSNKTCVAKKPLTNLYEMNSKTLLHLLWSVVWYGWLQWIPTATKSVPMFRVDDQDIVFQSNFSQN